MDYPIGTRIYNHGDMANVEHSGTIIRAWKDRWGSHYEVQIDDEDEAEGYKQHRYIIEAIMISPVYKGHGGTRIVTEAEHARWQAEQIEAFKARYA